jgi:MFS transporter, SHS family, lactate transporter
MSFEGAAMADPEPVSIAAPHSSAVAGRGPGASHMPAVIAGFTGWLLDAFDFFLVTFCLTAIARDFHKSDAQIALVITVTLLFRPVGGFVFGLIADRYGRRVPLMMNIGTFAVAEILTGLAPSYRALLVVRALFGVVMGGNWGVGASLAMEGAPPGRRGVWSGLLQEGYAAGNLLAGLCYFSLFGRFGWRPLFFVGSLPAVVLVLYIRFRVKESPVWQNQAAVKLSWGDQYREVLSHGKLFLYLFLLMSMMLFASHGTQDIYPTFLERQWHFNPSHRSAITAFSAVGAIVGGIVFGHFSDSWGRRRAIIVALAAGIAIIPLWAYAPNLSLLVAGAWLMQFMVQGAWGVIPAYLAELSPNRVRALLPGFAYQSAGLLASTVVYIEAVYAAQTSYATAMALTALCVFALASLMAWLGRERHGQALGG